MRTDEYVSSNLKSSSNYISGIDGLRAIAVLAVIAYHLQLPIAKGGLLGVTIFFVISGFLITRILITEIESTGTIDLKNFWIRRIRRLLPAILTMAVALIFVSVVFNRVIFTKACSDLLSAVFCYNNWWQIFNNVSYFENAGSPSPFTHCWSLAIEAQFYLIYPLILLILSRFKERKKIFLWVTIALAFVSAVLMWGMFNPSQDPSRVYYGTDTRVFSLLFGSLLAMITVYMNNIIPIIPVVREAIGAAALIGLFCMIVMINGYSSFLYRGGQILASVLAVAVIYALLNPKSILGKLLSLPFFRWIGERSYGIYLWHYPIILLISGGKRASWWIILIEIILTFVLSALSYHFVETPIRHGIIGKSIAFVTSRPRSKRERRKAVALLKKMMKISMGTAVIAVAAILCIIFVPRENALDNIDELERQAATASELAKEKAEQSSEKNSELQNISFADLTDEELLEKLQLLLIGDSIALDATDDFYTVFPNSISDAAVSRYTTESYDIYDSYVNDQNWNGDGVIFALGANVLLYDSLPTLRERMGAEVPLFIITARAPYTSWEESNNTEMREFVNNTDNTYLIDWYAASEGHPEYFADDETHLNETGAKAFVECIRENVLETYRSME